VSTSASCCSLGWCMDLEEGPTQDTLLRLYEGDLWNFNNWGCEDGSGPGELEEQGAEGHGWSNTTYPLMMMMKHLSRMRIECKQDSLCIRRGRLFQYKRSVPKLISQELYEKNRIPLLCDRVTRQRLISLSFINKHVLSLSLGEVSCSVLEVGVYCPALKSRVVFPWSKNLPF